MNKQYGINVMSYDMYSMATALPGVTVNIYYGATVVWTGTTNSTGYAKDANSLSPTLNYGNYTIECIKTNYTAPIKPITIPLVGDVNITMTGYQTIEINVSE